MTTRRTTIRCVTLCVGLASLIITGAYAEELPLTHKRNKLRGGAFVPNHFEVIQGDEESAKKYYREVASRQMNFETESTILGTTIKNLFVYFGYPELKPSDLHRLSSDELMALSGADDVLATAFFAPKISDVANKPADIPEGGFGWRKLVRLRAKPMSPADNNGMQALFLLQNIFEKTADGDAFKDGKNVSKFNQAIVMRRVGSGPYNDAKRPGYFFAYGPLVKIDSAGVPVKDAAGQFQDDGVLSFKLQATFDEGERDPETNAPAKDYFIPDSCQVCHGGLRNRVKLNFLDTDHWFDRVTPNYGLSDARFAQEDFTTLRPPNGVLYDGGNDPTTAKFAAAFNIIRKFNEEIKAQNADVVSPNNFQLAAATKWLELHAATITHVPPYERGFGTTPWDAADPNHRVLLYYLNRYCYRCHSSVKYNVFDRAAVKRLATRTEGSPSDIEDRLLNIDVDYFWMPQDRTFPGLAVNQGVGQATGDLKEFLDLLGQLQ